MDRLVAVVEALRDHCPWTAALTHADLAEYLVEEAYEAVAEIESRDAAAWADVPARRADGAYPALAAELGDVLFQVVLHAAVSRAPGAPAETAGFRLDDAADALTALTERREESQARLTAAEAALTAERARISAQLRSRADLQSAREVAHKTLTDAQTGLTALDTTEADLTERLTEARTRLTEAQSAAEASESGETELDAAHEAALAEQTALTERTDALRTELREVDTDIGRAEARAEPRSDFSSAGVKSFETPTSPMMPAMMSGFRAAPPTSATMKSATASTSMPASQSGWVCSR